MASNNVPLITDEAVDNFCAVTGASREIGSHFIEACGGDVQSAVEMYLDSPTSSTSVYARPSIHDNSNDNAGEGTSFQRSNQLNNVEVRAPIPQKKERLVDDGHGYIANMRRRPRPESVFDSFRNFHDEMVVDQSSDENTASRRKTLEQLFRPPIDLIFRGSFRAVMEYGASKNKWLIVNVQNVKEFSCQILNRDVWSNHAVKDLIKNRFVFWQVYSDSYEGKWYMQFYKVTSWPQVAILDPRTGEKMLECNKIDAELFCHLAEEFLATHETPNETPFSPSPNKKIRQNDDLLDASEEKQLEAALKASMSNESKANWAVLSYSDEETIDSADDDEPCNHDNEITSEQNRTEDSKELSFEDYLGPSTDAKTKLVVRLPNGERKILEWPCTSKLKALHLYVQENGYKNEEFEIVTNFPRKVLDMSNSDDTTLIDAKLHPQETVFVHMP